MFVTCGLARLFLHAKSLEVPHPRDASPLIVRVPLAEDLERCRAAFSV